MIWISGLLENVFINKQKNISLRKYTAYYLPNFVSSNNKKEIYLIKKNFFYPFGTLFNKLELLLLGKTRLAENKLAIQKGLSSEAKYHYYEIQFIKKKDEANY